jgi:signal transduction histidine kinase
MDKPVHEYTPEEVALITRIRVFFTIRWCVVAGTIVATLIAAYLFHIIFPILPIFIICAIIALYNLVLWLQLRNLDRKKHAHIIQTIRGIGNVHFFLDLIALAGILHFSGGIENPFIFYFVLHIIAASIVLNYRFAYLLGTTAVLIAIALVGLEYFNVIPHVNLQGFASPNLYHELSYILAILVTLTTLIYSSIYMVTSISGELRKRQRQVIQLRERLLEQKTTELEKATREINQLEEEKKRFLLFLSVAAHDLKAPLTAIQGYLWVMLDGYSGELNEKQRGMLERSSFRIRELLNLISNLLDIPRIETGQIIQEMKDVSLLDIVSTAIEDLRQIAEDKGLKINKQLPRKLKPVKCAEARIKQVIINLLDNAIRYTPEGHITVKVSEYDKKIKVEVMDTGIGIPEEDIPKLFQDFFRASNADIKGTGLGLAISRRIIEAHNGKIWVESPCIENKGGSKFAFILPAK